MTCIMLSGCMRDVGIGALTESEVYMSIEKYAATLDNNASKNKLHIFR